MENFNAELNELNAILKSGILSVIFGRTSATVFRAYLNGYSVAEIAEKMHLRVRSVLQAINEIKCWLNGEPKNNSADAA